MNFPTQMDQLIHDHQGARHADARTHRLARAARRTRRAPRRPIPAGARRRPDATELVMQLGAEVERLTSSPSLDRRTDRVAAALLVSASAALDGPARSVGLEPVPAGTPVIVTGRWLARLAERTAGGGLPLDAARTAELIEIVADLRSLSGGPATPAAAPVVERARMPARRPATVRLSAG